MNPRVRTAAKVLLPPVALSALRRLRALGQQPEWEFVGDDWPSTVGTGWADESVAKTQRTQWQAYVRSVESPKPLGRSPEGDGATLDRDYANHNTAMAFAYVMALASRSSTRLSLLDWGGGLGQYAVLARSLIPGLQIDYHCRELGPLVNVGRQLLPDATFHDSDTSVFSRRYDLVMASSSLQYVENWQALLAGLAGATLGYLYVTRQPFVQRASSFVVVQRPHRHGYATQYPGWVLNRGEFLEASEHAGLRLLREFLIDERPHIERAPEQPEYRGYLFAPAPQAQA